jgi:hypothetical protein
MSHLYQTYQLIHEEQDSLEAELAVVEIEQIFKRGAKKVEVVTFCSEPSDTWKVNSFGVKYGRCGMSE